MMLNIPINNRRTAAIACVTLEILSIVGISDCCPVLLAAGSLSLCSQIIFGHNHPEFICMRTRDKLSTGIFLETKKYRKIPNLTIWNDSVSPFENRNRLPI
jgi:hypothetical protein